MARKPRFCVPGIPQHIVQRGHNREACFFCENDYLRFRGDLADAAARNGVSIHAYVLMTNHVHLLATPDRRHGVTHMMQDLGRKFVGHTNRTYGRTGSLWEGRFKASLVEAETYLLRCMRYIELNPVRAGMVAVPDEYAWSSYAANARGHTDGLVSPHPLYLTLGASRAARLSRYRALFGCDPGADELNRVRQALNQELVLGRDSFKDEVERVLSRQARPRRPGRPRRVSGSAAGSGSGG